MLLLFFCFYIFLQRRHFVQFVVWVQWQRFSSLIGSRWVIFLLHRYNIFLSHQAHESANQAVSIIYKISEFDAVDQKMEKEQTSYRNCKRGLKSVRERAWVGEREQRTNVHKNEHTSCIYYKFVSYFMIRLFKYYSCQWDCFCRTIL